MRQITSLLLLVGLACTDEPPLTPAAPVGPATAMMLQPCTLTCVTTDPAGRSVAYRFDWDDGDTSEWSDFLSSGVSHSDIHAWELNATYLVRAQAKNSSERVSAWSAPETVKVDSICRSR